MMKNSPVIESKSGIFLLFEGLPPTIIESQVLAHVRNMDDVGVHMEVWTFAVTSIALAEGLAALPRLNKSFPSVKIRLFRGVKPALPFSDWCNAMLFMWWLWRLSARPAFIHARTEHATAIAAITKRFRYFHLIWDARGDALNEFRETAIFLPKLLRWLAPLKERVIKNRLAIARQCSDSAIFVSDALRKLQGDMFPMAQTIVIPCLADESIFFVDQDLRAEKRRLLGYSESDIVISYVGSTSIWQCVPETVVLIERALHVNPTCKALIITSDQNAFKNVFSNELLNRIQIKTSALNEVNSYLNAVDFGILLRKTNKINWVASPVKFAEYCLTGLVVVTADAVEQVNLIGRELGNTISGSDFLNFCKQKSFPLPKRNAIADEARTILGRKSQIDKLLQFYNCTANNKSN